MTQSTDTNYDLTDRAALVTGASRGFGRAIALQLARAGAHVALLARDAHGLAETARLARADASGPQQRIVTAAVDLLDDAALATKIAALTDAFPQLDILVNNAGIQGPIGSFATAPPAAWRKVFELNLFAAAECCRLAFPHFQARGGGKVINISGGGATGPRADFSAYSASKAALVRFSETLAEEWREHRIDVNCVAPGAMNTAMLREILEAGPERARHEHARALDQETAGGTPLETGAELVCFLASSASDGITGRLLSAVWDDWRSLPQRREALARSDLFTLRRIVPLDRGLDW